MSYNQELADKLAAENEAKRREADATPIQPTPLSSEDRATIESNAKTNAEAYSRGDEVTIATKDTTLAPADPIKDRDDAVKADKSQMTYREVKRSEALIQDDATRYKMMKEVVANGHKLSEIKEDKFGADPMVFALKTMYAKAKENNVEPEDFKKYVDNFIVDNWGAAELKKLKETHRFQNGLASSIMEAANGAQEIFGSEVSDKHRIMADILYQDKERASSYHNYSNAYRDKNGLNYSWDIQTGIGEAAPSIVIGGGTGIIAKSVGMGAKAALFTDFVAQQTFSTMEYTGASSKDEQAGTQYSIETAANIALPIVGSSLAKVFGKAAKEIPSDVVEAVNKIDQDKAAIFLKAMQIAKENGMNVLGHDVDPTTLVSKLQDAAKNSPLVSRQLQELTNSDVKALTAYLSHLQNGFIDVATTNKNVGLFISDTLDNQDTAFVTAADAAYRDLDILQDNMEGNIQNGTFIKWLNGIKTEFSKSSDLGVAGGEAITSYIDKTIARYTTNGAQVGVKDANNILRDMIQHSAELRKAGKAQESRGMVKLSEKMEAQFDIMTSNNPTIRDASAKARKLYRDRIELLGHKDTGKGSKGTGIVADFRAKYAENPEGAVKLINTPQKLREIMAQLDETGVNILKRNHMNNLMESATNGGVFNATKFGNLIESDAVFNRTLFGDDYSTVVATGKLAQLIGKRADKLGKNNSFSLLNTLNNASIVKSAWDWSIGRIKGKALLKQDARQALALMDKFESTLQKAGISNIDEYLSKVAKSSLPEATVRQSAEDLYTPIEGLVRNETGEVITSTPEMTAKRSKAIKKVSTQLHKDIRTTLATKQTTPELTQELAELKAKHSREVTEDTIEELKAFRDKVDELPSKDPAADMSEAQAIRQARAERMAKTEKARQQARQVSNVSSEITGIFRIKQLEADSRLLFNRILDEIKSYTNKGNEEAVSRAIDKLDTFREYARSLPNRLSVEERKAVQLKAARAEAARLTEEGITSAEERSARIVAAQDSAVDTHVADTLNLQARRNIARDTDTSVEHIATSSRSRRELAEEGILNKLNASGREDISTWTRGRGSSDNSPYYTATWTAPDGHTEEVGFYLSIYGNNLGATTTRLKNGAKMGEFVYPAIFDMARNTGSIYKPCNTLLTANPVRTGMNMLEYAGKLGGKDISWVRLNRSQVGVSGSMNNELLTRQNQKKLNKGLASYMKTKLIAAGLPDPKLNSRITAAQIDEYGGILGANPNIRMGPNSIKKLVNWMYSSRPGVTLGAVSIAYFLSDSDIMDFLDGEHLPIRGESL